MVALYERLSAAHGGRVAVSACEALLGTDFRKRETTTTDLEHDALYVEAQAATFVSRDDWLRHFVQYERARGCAFARGRVPPTARQPALSRVASRG